MHSRTPASWSRWYRFFPGWGRASPISKGNPFRSPRPSAFRWARRPAARLPATISDAPRRNGRAGGGDALRDVADHREGQADRGARRARAGGHEHRKPPAKRPSGPGDAGCDRRRRARSGTTNAQRRSNSEQRAEARSGEVRADTLGRAGTGEPGSRDDQDGRPGTRGMRAATEHGKPRIYRRIVERFGELPLRYWRFLMVVAQRRVPARCRGAPRRLDPR